MEKKQKRNLSSGKIKKTHKNVKSKENLCVIGRGKIKTTPVSLGNPWKIQPPHAENPLERTIIITNPKILHPRSKYLMTKYGRKWLVKVYGRISPTRAREMYNGRLLHVILKRWDGVVWRDCHEWKLMIRAECHDRYRLWYMAWNKWRMFIKIRQDNNRKVLLGQQLVSHNKMKCFFKYWKERVELNNLQQKHVIMADGYRHSVERKNLKMCLVKWYNDTINRQRDNSMADHQYNGQLIAKCYNHWMSEYDMKLTSRDFHCKRLMQKHFHIWMKYIEIRQLKTSAKNTAVMFDVRRLLAGHFDKWKFSNQRLHLMYQLQLKVDCTNQRLLLERAVSSWRSYVEYCHIKSDQLSVAIHHHTRLVKLKVLRIFQKYHNQQEISRCHSQTAASFDTARLMKWSWRVWLRRCEHNEDIKLHPLTKQGLHHYRIVAMTTHWKAWRCYMKYRRLQKYSNKCAVDHLRMKTLRRYFNLFKNNVQWSLYKKELCMKSLNFRRNVLLCQCFYHWWNKSITECRTRDHMTQAVKHYHMGLLRYSISQWRIETHHRLYTAQCEVVSLDHYNYRLMKCVLNKWRDRANGIKLRRLSIMKDFEMQLLHQIIHRWRKYSIERVRKRESDMTANEHYQNKILTKHMTIWKVYHRKCNINRDRMKLAITYQERSLQRHVFTNWLLYVRYLIKRRHDLITALKYQHKIRYKRMFTLWRGRAVERAELALKEDNLVAMATDRLHQKMMRRMITKWHTWSRDEKARKKARKMAVKFNNRMMMMKYTRMWSRYHLLRLHKKELSSKGDHFNAMKLLAKCYKIWKGQLVEKSIEHKKTSVALWKWSRNLEYKVFKGWKERVRDKERKRKRYEGAMESYRNNLLEKGVIKWIEAASTIQSIRNERATKLQNETHSKLWTHVRKCAIHWRNVVITRRKGTAPLTLTSSTSNEFKKKTMFANRVAVDTVTLKVPMDTVTKDTHWDSLMKVPSSSSTQRLPPRVPSYLTNPSVNISSFHPVTNLVVLPSSKVPPSAGIDRIPSSHHVPPSDSVPSSHHVPPSDSVPSSHHVPPSDSVPSSHHVPPSDSVPSSHHVPQQCSPPTPYKPDSFLSLTATSDTSYHGNNQDTRNIALTTTRKWQLLPPSAFKKLKK